MDSCIFCEILAGNLEGSFVFRDLEVCAFMDINPINQGHVLILPIQHHERVSQVPEPILGKMLSLAKDIQAQLGKANINCEASNFFISDGEQAGQEVPHAHLHLVPRSSSDQVRIQIRSQANIPNDRASLNLLAAKLAKSLTESSWLPPVLETKRLILRPMTEADTQGIFDYCSDPEVAKYVTWEAHKTLKDSENFVKYAQQNYRKKRYEPYAIAFKEKPEQIIGTVGFFWVSERSKSIEIAYALARPHWGKGYMAEASHRVLTHAIKEVGVQRIQSRCLVENIGSARVMEKLGMKYEGTTRSAMFLKNRFIDLKNYAVLAEEFDFAF